MTMRATQHAYQRRRENLLSATKHVLITMACITVVSTAAFLCYFVLINTFKFVTN